MNLRAAKRSSTRTAIEHAAWLLAENRPWVEVTIDDIAADAGVARRTFFNYFESKDQLYDSLGAWRPGDLLAAFRKRPESEHPWVSLRAALMTLLASSSRESVERMLALWREPSLVERTAVDRRQLEKSLDEEIRRRRPDLTEAESLLLCAVFLTAARSALQSWVGGGEAGRLTSAVSGALDAVVVQVGEPPPGR